LGNRHADTSMEHEQRPHQRQRQNSSTVNVFESVDAFDSPERQ
jgi:hypothetical protein